MNIQKKGENAYFAASNSAKGFFSYYSQCFDSERIAHVYAVKGGPGTGKSRFMREVAQEGERNGWSSEYIYCSSDPDSLDGVILSRAGEECFAVLDATAPHVYEPTRPGLREDIVNLGAFWNAELLRAHADRIESLNRQKSEAYRQAYRFLAAVGDMEQTQDELTAPFIKHGAIDKMAARLMREIEDGSGYTVSPALIHSVGMRGRVSFDTYFAMAERIYVIEDCRGSAQYLMQSLGEQAVKKNLSIRISHDPITPHKIDGLFLCESGIAYAVLNAKDCAYPHQVLSMRRFVETARMRGVRNALNYAARMRRAMLDGAIERLERVRQIHFELEEIYISSMDFEQKEKFTKSFCQRLFHLKK